MPVFPQLPHSLAKDAAGKSFVGPNGRVPKGLDDPSDDDLATPYNIIVSTDGETPLLNPQGLFVQGPLDHDAPGIAVRPIVIGGIAESTVPSAVIDSDIVKAFFDLLGQLAVRPNGSTGAALFPDAAALADDTTNPTLTKIASYIMGFDGTTWDRIRGTSTNGLAVDVTRVGKSAISPAAPTFATVGTSSAQAVAQNNNRKGLILTNTSANIIYLGIDATAVVGRGIILFPNGVWNMGEYDFTTLAVLAIASGASSNMAVQEFS